MSDQTARLRASVSVFSALRHPQYRRFWIGNLASVSGQQAMWVVHGWLIYELTEYSDGRRRPPGRAHQPT